MRRNPTVIALTGLGVLFAATALGLRLVGGLDGAGTVLVVLSLLAYVASRIVDRRSRRAHRSE